MSFLSFLKTPQTNKNLTLYLIRKEKDSFMTRHKKKISHLRLERASAFTSKASITVEASFVVSFFFLAVMCFVCLLEIMAIQVNIKSAMHSAGKELAMEAYGNPIFSPNRLEKKIVETVGGDRLDESLIVGGRYGIDCSGSKTYVGSTIIDLCAYYQLEIPVFAFRVPILAREEIIRIKGWSGSEEGHVSSQDRKMVYVTDHGIVYHQSLTCTYLELSIRAIPYESIEDYRNETGGKYYACEICGGKVNGQSNVYITEQGERYHCSLECRGIRRNIYAVPLSDVYGLGGCSKCVK